MSPTGIILDVDETLADTSAALFDYMIENIGSVTGQDALELQKEYGLPGLVPEWQLLRAQQFMQTFLTSESFLMTLEPIVEAQVAVALLHTAQPIAGYLTSRLLPLHSVTEQWLKLHGFPDAPVVCRPPEVVSSDWKIKYLIEELPEVSAIIDNELYVPETNIFPGQLIELPRYKKISPSDHRVRVCKSWDEVIRIVG